MRPSCKRSAVGLTGTAPSSFMQRDGLRLHGGLAGCVGQKSPKSPVKTRVSDLCVHFASRREPRAGANSGRWFSHRSIWGRRVRMFASYFQMLENTLPRGPGGGELGARGWGREREDEPGHLRRQRRGAQNAVTHAPVPVGDEQVPPGEERTYTSHRRRRGGGQADRQRDGDGQGTVNATARQRRQKQVPGAGCLRHSSSGGVANTEGGPA